MKNTDICETQHFRNDNSLELGLAMDVHEFFRLDKREAEEIIIAVKNSIKNWRNLANILGISKAQQELKALAFSQSDE
ncbi:hypothetical protein SYJ56_04870 [Algoriphagus sp. D3-2-R+10]|uniref:hypothetical protein n=1 Tax=Algoriphagus aurantiacus TaxID=3103948 RepID=UPI002B39A2AD|nr:hypothetical protein [Algoriphagus sp. D3-2-R+10]MEB2774626.1 hypothetical protein [Algoriphagus sp. D3-2-R+10]